MKSLLFIILLAITAILIPIEPASAWKDGRCDISNIRYLDYGPGLIRLEFDATSAIGSSSDDSLETVALYLYHSESSYANGLTEPGVQLTDHFPIVCVPDRGGYVGITLIEYDPEANATAFGNYPNQPPPPVFVWRAVHTSFDQGNTPRSDRFGFVNPAWMVPQLAEVDYRIASTYEAVAPTRLLDTRNGNGPVSNSTIQLPMGNVDRYTSTGVYNITVTNVTAAGYATLYQCGVARPAVSNLNFALRDTRANMATVPLLTTNTSLCLYVHGTTDVIVDQSGRYQRINHPGTPAPIYPKSREGRLVTGNPARRYDSRSAGGAFYPGETRFIPVTTGGYFDSAVLNLTVMSEVQGYWTAYGSQEPTRPNTSSVNVSTVNQPVANQAVVKLDANGGMYVYSQGGGHLVVDLTAAFTNSNSPYSATGLFVPTHAFRKFDTRTGIFIPANDRTTTHFGVGLPGNVQSAAIAVSGNLTAVAISNSGWLTAFPGGDTPGTSSVNFATGQVVANHITTSLDDLENMSIYSPVAAHAILDISGFYTRG